MENSFQRACTEVLEILKFLPPAEYEKIPKEEIEFLESKKDEQYKFNIDKSLPLQQINISKRANAIMVILWEKYFATPVQREKLNIILKQNEKIAEEKKKEKYSHDKLFRKGTKKENVELVPILEEKWYEKIYNFCKKIMHKLWSE